MTGPFFRFELWTNRLLGTVELGHRILDTAETVDGGRWLPERWGPAEPVKMAYTRESRPGILDAWTEVRPPGSGEIYNWLLLRKKRPRFEFFAKTVRLSGPSLNWIRFELEANSFAKSDSTARLLRIFRTWIETIDAVYGSVHYSRQAHKRIAQRTPLQRIEKVEWLNFFGTPYVKLIGQDRLRTCPGCEIEELPQRGFIVQLNGQFNDPAVVDSDQSFLGVERHLGTDLFAGYGYPEKPCRVPEFDLSEVTLPPPESEAVAKEPRTIRVFL